MGLFDSLFGKTKEEEKNDRANEDPLSYTVNLDIWLSGVDIFHTGLYKKHPEVRRRSHKALIEETIKVHGGLVIQYGEDNLDRGEYIPLSVDEENVVCRELIDYERASKKTFKLTKIELIKYFPVINEPDYVRNVQDINDAIQKKALITTFAYFDEKGQLWESGQCNITPLKIDNGFFYCRKKGGKEEKIKLKWVKYLEYYADEEAP